MSPTVRGRIEAQIEELQARIATLKGQLNDDPYPVGTILRSGGGIMSRYLIKFESMSSPREGCEDDVSTPCWVSLYDDFSGGTYATLADAEDENPTLTEVYVPHVQP